MTLPNQLSVLRIILTPLFIFLLFQDHLILPWMALAIFTLAALTDWYDGYTARKSGAISEWGKFLDPLADKILVISALFTFSHLGYFPIWMVIVVLIRDLLITILRAYAIYKEKPVVTNFFAKLKTFVQFVVVYFVFILYLLSLKVGENQFQGILSKIQTWNVSLILMGLITLITISSGLIYLVENKIHLQMLLKDAYRIFAPSDV
jgi:CDP-diacylglycerol--glycerol-3-phosphate 3-phosphatidyltransferase